MQLPKSYEALFQRAVEATDFENLGPAMEQFEYLTNRLLSLPATLRERKPQLRQILTQSAARWLTFLRWEGRNEDALALLPRFREALPDWSATWDLEEALNRIDAGEVSKGLDMLRAFRMRHTESRLHPTMILARELFGAGLYDEAETLAQAALRAADEVTDEVDAALLLVHIETERDNPEGIETNWKLALGKADEEMYMYPMFERLSALGHWDRLEGLLRQEKDSQVRRLFQGEVARAKGDEAEAQTQWHGIVDSSSVPDEEANMYARLSARLFLEQPQEVCDIMDKEYKSNPNDTALILFVAALAQAGQLDKAEEILKHGLRRTRFLRPRRDRFPPSYWLRLRRFPMPQEALETLEPYFAQPGA